MFLPLVFDFASPHAIIDRRSRLVRFVARKADANKMTNAQGRRLPCQDRSAGASRLEMSCPRSSAFPIPYLMRDASLQGA
jgi:hypothetical protein